MWGLHHHLPGLTDRHWHWPPSDGIGYFQIRFWDRLVRNAALKGDHIKSLFLSFVISNTSVDLYLNKTDYLLCAWFSMENAWRHLIWSSSGKIYHSTNIFNTSENFSFCIKISSFLELLMKTQRDAPDNLMAGKRWLLSHVFDLKQRLGSGLLFPSVKPGLSKVRDCLSPCLYCSTWIHFPLPMSVYFCPIFS